MSITKRAAELIKKGGLSFGKHARLKGGQPCGFTDPAAKCFCIRGALLRACYEAHMEKQKDKKRKKKFNLKETLLGPIAKCEKQHHMKTNNNLVWTNDFELKKMFAEDPSAANKEAIKIIKSFKGILENE